MSPKPLLPNLKRISGFVLSQKNSGPFRCRMFGGFDH
jgi:hypothetical protein